MCLPKDRTIGGGESRASGEIHAVTGLYLSVACRSDDGFDELGRKDHSYPHVVDCSSLLGSLCGLWRWLASAGSANVLAVWGYGR